MTMALKYNDQWFLSVLSLTSNKAIKGKNRSRCSPFKYKSHGGRLEVATITAPRSNRPVKSRRRMRASATSVTYIGVVKWKALSSWAKWNLQKHYGMESIAQLSLYETPCFPGPKTYLKLIKTYDPTILDSSLNNSGQHITLDAFHHLRLVHL